MTEVLNTKDIHSFYIPVMGTAFTIATPIQVARFGISSVMSIGDDELVETMRKYYTEKYNLPFESIPRSNRDYRALRVTAYLNLVQDIVDIQIRALKKEAFEPGTEITRYFEMLDNASALKAKYQLMLTTEDKPKKELLQEELRALIRPGSIDVNIMTKVDKDNFDKDGNKLPIEFTDAISVFRGFANSKLNSSIIFSAGFNRRLYAYVENCEDFFPDENGCIKKKIVLKVSDFRSSLTQGKFFAKKGLWVYEHRIESGLNCGGHAFGKDGYLLGPILEEFSAKKEELSTQFFTWVNEALAAKGRSQIKVKPEMRITVQGGIGTAQENTFLLKNYKVNATGWATPFMLVPEAVTIDKETLDLLINAEEKDLYLSNVSPLGIPFNTVRGTKSEQVREKRIQEQQPGSICPKGHLALWNTEFSEKPLCLATTTYQSKKLAELKSLNLSAEEYQKQAADITAKTCLCEDLAAPALIANKIFNKRQLNPIACPGPNLAYFSRKFSLTELVGHIYGKWSVLNETPRSNMFIQELKIYIDYFTTEIKKSLPTPSGRQVQTINEIGKNLLKGIEYYKGIIPKLVEETTIYQHKMKAELLELKADIEKIVDEYPLIFNLNMGEALFSPA